MTDRDATGAFHVHDLAVPIRGRVQPVTANVTLAPAANGAIAATVDATLAGVTAHGGATVIPPEHFAERSAWHDFGMRGVRAGSLRVDDVGVATIAAILGVPTPVDGHASVVVELPDLATGARVTASVRGVRGGQIVLPLDATVTGTIDGRGAVVDVGVRDANGQLISGHVSAPLQLASLVANDAAAVKAVAITGCVEGGSG